MKALKIVLDLVVIAYVIFAVLLLTTLLDGATFFNLSTDTQLLNLYKILFGIGALLLLVRLCMASMIISFKQQDMHKAQLKINELKAELYEKRQAFRNTDPASRPAEATLQQKHQLTYSK